MCALGKGQPVLSADSGVSGPAGVHGDKGVWMLCPWPKAGDEAYDEHTVDGARDDERE